MNEARSITFEDGYRRLQQIAERVSSDEVPVHEMCDLFAEGKGLATALSGYLEEQKARVDAIERGEEVQAFRVVAPSGGDEGDGGSDFEPAGGSDVEPAGTGERGDAAAQPGDDDIPF